MTARRYYEKGSDCGALITGVVFGAFFWYANATLTWAIMGFISGFMAIVSHMIGDMFTYMAFKPLWPFDHRLISWGFCRASNPAVNEGLATAGSAAFILYILNGTGALTDILSAFL